MVIGYGTSFTSKPWEFIVRRRRTVLYLLNFLSFACVSWDLRAGILFAADCSNPEEYGLRRRYVL